MKASLQIGDWLVDVETGTISGREHTVQLEPKVMEVLAFLSQNPDQVLSKDRIIRAVWPDTFVTDDALKYAILTLRRAFQDDARHPKVIQTLPKRGYRLIAPVRRKSDTSSQEQPRPGAGKFHSRRYLLAGGVLLLVLSTWLFVGKKTAPTSSHRLASLPVTTLVGEERHPAFSPDGSQMVFVWNGESGDNFDIYVKVIGRPEYSRLTSDPGVDFSPLWSPDGTEIVFFRLAENGVHVFVVSPMGGAERQVGYLATPGVLWRLWQAAWLPDARSRLLALSDRIPSDPDGRTRIVLYSLQNRQTSPLTDPKPPDSDCNPIFSAGGDLYFLRGHSRESMRLYQQRAGETSPRLLPLPESLKYSAIARAAWSPSGSVLLAIVETIHSRLVELPVDGREPTVQADNGWDPAVSSQTGRVAFTQGGWDLNVYEYRLDSLVVQSKRRIIQSTRADGDPRFSPDGRRIAFHSERSGRPEIWVCNSDGSRPDRLLPQMTGLGCGSPRWSPNSAFLAFDGVLEKDGGQHIYVVDASGERRRQLTNTSSNARNARPSWSGDGDWIYFGSDRSGEWQIWKTRSNGVGEAVPITRKGGFEAFESKDSKYLYYTKFYGTKGIWRVPVGGGSEDRVYPYGENALWDVGRKGIYLVNSDRKTRPAVEIWDPGSRKGRPLFLLSPERPWDHLGNGFAVAPDDSRLLWSEWDGVDFDIVMSEGKR